MVCRASWPTNSTDRSSSYTHQFSTRYLLWHWCFSNILERVKLCNKISTDIHRTTFWVGNKGKGLTNLLAFLETELSTHMYFPCSLWPGWFCHSNRAWDSRCGWEDQASNNSHSFTPSHLTSPASSEDNMTGWLNWTAARWDGSVTTLTSSWRMPHASLNGAPCCIILDQLSKWGPALCRLPVGWRQGSNVLLPESAHGPSIIRCALAVKRRKVASCQIGAARRKALLATEGSRRMASAHGCITSPIWIDGLLVGTRSLWMLLQVDG